MDINLLTIGSQAAVQMFSSQPSHGLSLHGRQAMHRAHLLSRRLVRRSSRDRPQRGHPQKTPVGCGRWFAAESISLSAVAVHGIDADKAVLQALSSLCGWKQSMILA